MSRLEQFISKSTEDGKHTIHVDLPTLVDIVTDGDESLTGSELAEYVNSEVAEQGYRLSIWRGNESVMATLRKKATVSAETEGAFLEMFGRKSEQSENNEPAAMPDEFEEGGA